MVIRVALFCDVLGGIINNDLTKSTFLIHK